MVLLYKDLFYHIKPHISHNINNDKHCYYMIFFNIYQQYAVMTKAVKCNFIKCVYFIINYTNVDLDYADYFYLRDAIYYKNYKIAKMIIENLTDIDKLLIYKLFKIKNEKFVTFLCKNKLVIDNLSYTEIYSLINQKNI